MTLAQRALDGLPQTVPSDVLVALKTIVEPGITQIVGMLANPAEVPLPAINDLAGLMWRLVGSHTTEVAGTDMPQVTSLAFLGMVWPAKKMSQGVFLFPLGYSKTLLNDTWMQLGGVVYNASKARDLWNGKLADHANVMKRAAAYEAQFLRYALTQPGFTPNGYQQGVLDENTVDMPPELAYTSRPFDLDRAQREFKSYSGFPIMQPTPPPHLLMRG